MIPLSMRTASLPKAEVEQPTQLPEQAVLQSAPPEISPLQAGKAVRAPIPATHQEAEEAQAVLTVQAITALMD